MEQAAWGKLVQQAQQGDEQAAKELYNSRCKSVYFLALKLLRNEQDAQDLTQEVFLTAFEKLAQLKNTEGFGRWLQVITANKCTNLLRRRKELPAPGHDVAENTDLPEENPAMLPQKSLDDTETRTLILEVIDKLPTPQRACVYYYYYEQLTVAQIAENLGVSQNTVKSRLAYARNKIKAELESRQQQDGVKLYAVPLALGPVLAAAGKAFTMPGSLAGSIWQRIAAELPNLAGPTGAAVAGAAAGAGVAAGAAGAAGSAAAAGASAAAGGTAGAAASGTAAGLTILGLTKGKLALAAASIGTAAIVGGALLANVIDNSMPSPSIAPYSQPAPAAAVSVSSPQPAQPQDVNWRQRYYDVIILQLHADPALLPVEIRMLYPPAGPPVVSIVYGLREEYNTHGFANVYHTKMWSLRDGITKLIFDRPTTGICVRNSTGNPVYFSYDTGMIAIELVNGQEKPLYELKYQSGTDYYTAYTFSDGKSWTREQWNSAPLLQQYRLIEVGDKCPLNKSGQPLASQAQLEQRLSDYLLATYQPTVPDGAPSWVGDYVRYIRTQLPATYPANSRISTIADQLTLYDPIKAGEAPPFYSRRLSEWNMGEFPALYLKRDNGMHTFSEHQEGRHQLFQDANGKVIVAANDYNSWRWYKPTSTGIEYMFSDGINLPDSADGSGYMSSETEQQRYTNYQQAEQWVEARRMQSLQKRGYQGPLTPCKEYNYPINMNRTWNELEPLLIDLFCQHAKAIGQWGR